MRRMGTGMLEYCFMLRLECTECILFGFLLIVEEVFILFDEVIKNLKFHAVIEIVRNGWL